MKAKAIETNAEYQARFLEINQFDWLPSKINQHNGFPLNKADTKELKTAYKTQAFKTTALRILLNVIPVLLTGPIFHLLYWAFQAFKFGVSAIYGNMNAKFKWDWSRVFSSIDTKVYQLERVNSFIEAQADFIPEVEASEEPESEDSVKPDASVHSDNDPSEQKKSEAEKSIQAAEAQANLAKEAEEKAKLEQEERVRQEAEQAKPQQKDAELDKQPDTKDESLDLKGTPSRVDTTVPNPEVRLDILEDAARLERADIANIMSKKRDTHTLYTSKFPVGSQTAKKPPFGHSLFEPVHTPATFTPQATVHERNWVSADGKVRGHEYYKSQTIYGRNGGGVTITGDTYSYQSQVGTGNGSSIHQSVSVTSTSNHTSSVTHVL